MFRGDTLKIVASMTILVLITLMHVSAPIVVRSGIREVHALTTSHYVTVASNGEGFDIAITPLNLSAKSARLMYSSLSASSKHTSCSCPVARAVRSVNVPTAILFQNSTYILVKHVVSYGNKSIEVIASGKLLWQWVKSGEKENRSAYLYQVEIASANRTLHYYMLTYRVRALDYNLTIATQLIPANESFYNYSFTYVVYMPKEKRVVSLEIVKFNKSVTLSQLYQALSRAAKELRHIYQTSSNTTIRSLKDGYLTIEKELDLLAKLVEKELPQYNKPVIHGTAIITDDWISCLICNALVGVICGLIGSVAVSLLCPTACTIVCAIFAAEWWIAIICGVVCGSTCSTLVETIIGIGVSTACSLGGSILCSYIGAC
uniref:Uncharacterized protein n=1 Tax=Ignisphaera aggregans TaxID=334771 RepID=A0A7J2U5E8_9CREN